MILCDTMCDCMYQERLKFLTVEEVADRFMVNPATIRKAIRMGKIYAFRPGAGKKSPYRISETEVERLQLHGMYENKE